MKYETETETTATSCWMGKLLFSSEYYLAISGITCYNCLKGFRARPFLSLLLFGALSIQSSVFALPFFVLVPQSLIFTYTQE